MWHVGVACPGSEFPNVGNYDNVPSCMVFHNRCLWSFAPEYYISQLDILYPYNPPKHCHFEQFEHLSKSAAPTVKKIISNSSD